MLSMSAPAQQSAMVFTGVFVVIWAGAAVVTINAQLLGSTMSVDHWFTGPRDTRLTNVPGCARSSFFQSVCVLGYCVFPLNLATLLCMVLKVVVSHVLLRLVIVAVGFLWSTRGMSPFSTASSKRHAPPLTSLMSRAASVVFMSKLVPPKRKALTVYPVLLFYLFISWMVLIQ